MVKARLMKESAGPDKAASLSDQRLAIRQRRSQRFMSPGSLPGHGDPPTNDPDANLMKVAVHIYTEVFVHLIRYSCSPVFAVGVVI